MNMLFSLIALLIAGAPVLTTGAAEPQTTSAPAGAGSNFVGWISESERYINSRTCDYPQTVSTSGAFVQCCSPTGSCPFYTACSSNTLLQASGSPVACDVDTSLTCNTGVVITTSDISSGNSYLACWQTSLGTNPFTFVQNIGTATIAPSTTTSSASPGGASYTSNSGSLSGSGLSGSTLTSSSSGSVTSATASASASPSNGAGVIGGGALGALALIAQAFL